MDYMSCWNQFRGQFWFAKRSIIRLIRQSDNWNTFDHTNVQLPAQVARIGYMHVRDLVLILFAFFFVPRVCLYLLWVWLSLKLFLDFFNILRIPLILWYGGSASFVFLALFDFYLYVDRGFSNLWYFCYFSMLEKLGPG